MLQNPFTRTPAKIAVIGLGYVGLPLAVAFARENEVVGFDIGERRIDELLAGQDRTLEVSTEELAGATNLRLTTDAADLRVQEWERLMDGYQQRLPWAKPGEKWVAMRGIFSLKEALEANGASR